ncbi:MAG: hypothetical protein ACJZ2G_02705 [Thalassobaculaceae bacterium]
MELKNEVLGEFGTTVFEVMSRLAIEHNSINLGQGFPDGVGPKNILEKGSKFALFVTESVSPP